MPLTTFQFGTWEFHKPCRLQAGASRRVLPAGRSPPTSIEAQMMAHLKALWAALHVREARRSLSAPPGALHPPVPARSVRLPRTSSAGGLSEPPGRFLPVALRSQAIRVHRRHTSLSFAHPHPFVALECGTRRAGLPSWRLRDGNCAQMCNCGAPMISRTERLPRCLPCDRPQAGRGSPFQWN